jgi:hypothetical protein
MTLNWTETNNMFGYGPDTSGPGRMKWAGFLNDVMGRWVP